jgi:hypothetical protein
MGNPPIRATRGKRKLKFKSYTMDSHNTRLLDHLEEWRDATAEAQEAGNDKFFGSLFIATDEILERIVVR